MTRAADAAGAINLGQGICDLPTPAPVADAAVQAIRDRKSTYTYCEGDGGLRRKIAEKLARVNGIEADPETDIVVTAGSAAAFTCVLHGLFDPGDELLIPEPYYGYHVGAARVAGVVPAYVGLRAPGFELTEELLRAAVTPRTRGLVLCTPSNPSGRMLTRSELEAAARVAAAERAAKRRVRADDIEPATRLFAAIGGAMSAATYMEEVQRVHAFGRTMGRFFEDVDVLITATVARPPARVGELSPSWGESVLARFLAALKIRPLLNVALKEMAKAPLAATPNTQPFNMTGQPAISLPLHRSEGGLPVGTQFVGRFGDEAALLRLAGQLEASARWADERPPVCVGAPPVSDGA